MTVHNITDTRLQLGQEEIEEVNEFVYLGSIMSKRVVLMKTQQQQSRQQKLFSQNYHPYGNQTNFFKNQNKVI
jgi:hypothetical protein